MWLYNAITNTGDGRLLSSPLLSLDYRKGILFAFSRPTKYIPL